MFLKYHLFLITETTLFKLNMGNNPYIFSSLELFFPLFILFEHFKFPLFKFKISNIESFL